VAYIIPLHQVEIPAFRSLVLLFLLQVEARAEAEDNISLILLVKLAVLAEVEVAVVATVQAVKLPTQEEERGFKAKLVVVGFDKE
jgi:hypothetical protein